MNLLKKEYKCALCGKSFSQIELIMPTGNSVCYKCGENIYIAVGALKAWEAEESSENNKR